MANKKGTLKNVVISNNTTRKDFKYNLGDVQLNFSLRVDVQTELKAFKELMLTAIGDIDKEIARLKEGK